MKFRTSREEEQVLAKMITITIGEETYRITETIDGKMKINKTSDSDSDMIYIHPITGNEIEIF